MGCATGFIKCSLSVFNIIWMIIGVLVIVFGGLGWDAMPQSYAIGTIVLGGLIVLMSLFGFFGVVRESARVMWAYAAFLTVLLVFVIVFICLSTRNVFTNFAKHMVEELWEKELISPGAMDNMQLMNSCCGLDSKEDYDNIGRITPSSCCKNMNCINPFNQYNIGCREKAEMDFADEATMTQYVQWGLLGADLIILVLTTLLAIRFTNRNRRYNY